MSSTQAKYSKSTPNETSQDGHLQLSEAGPNKAERTHPPKNTHLPIPPRPLHIYFNIIMAYLIVSGNHQALLEFAHGSSKYIQDCTSCTSRYISGLYKLYIKYEWPQVLEYHFRFTNRRIVEMQEGPYAVEHGMAI